MRIEARDLAVRVGSRKLFEGLNFVWDRPGLVSVIGPSGSGKSTLLSVIMGWTKVSRGSVLVHSDRGKAWLVPQNAPLLDTRSVQDNLEVALIAESPDSVASTTVDDALAAYNLAHLAESRAKHLSGGERQRVALARAALRRPEILLADEVTAGLDPDSVVQVSDALIALAASGSLVVAATHDERLWSRAGTVLDLAKDAA